MQKGTNETGCKNLKMSCLFDEWIIGKSGASGFFIVDTGREQRAYLEKDSHGSNGRSASWYWFMQE